MSTPAPGWYPHPHDPALLRWWDGDAWTDHVQPVPDTAPQVSEPALAPVTSGGEFRGWDPHRADVEPATTGSFVAPVSSLGALGESGVMRDVTAPWQLPDLEPAPGGVPDADELRPTNGNGNGNGYGNGNVTYGVREPERAPYDPPPWPDPAADSAESADEGPSRIRRMLIAGIVVVGIAIGGGVAYKQGLLDSVIGGGGSSRAASSSAVQVYDHARYSFEAPRTWETVPAEAYGSDFGFATPNSSVAVLDSSVVEANLDVTNPATQNFVFDTALRGLELQTEGLAVQSSTPYTTGGVVGKQVVLSGMGADGQVMRVRYTVFVRDRLVVLSALVQRGAAADDPATQAEYDGLLSSFQYPTSD